MLQKYDTPKLVDVFLATPQRRLKFLDPVDRVVEYGGTLAAPLQPSPTRRRKLFQPSHFRHYLVVCSLHCDVPGLPPVDREQVCQQGFVIRRRDLTATDADARTARRKIAAVDAARRAIATIDGHIVAARGAPNIPGVRLAALQTRRDAAVTVYQQASEELRAWAVGAGVGRALKGWHAGPNDGEGAWADISEVPDDVTEQAFPLYPLVAPPGKEGHDAAGQTILFGLVPTASADHGRSAPHPPRFDDHSAYEIRCFVRRHAPNCATDEDHPSPSGADCRGQVVWSEPTEVFGLAAHFDLRGTANRPINVQLPDLRALKAQAGQSPAGVQFTTPPFSAVAGDGPNNGNFQICSFSIPLITIVAMFVFQLFLPIVILLFQLWFLLLLKFCIPPEIKFGGNMEAAITVNPLDAQFDIDVEANLDAALGLFGPGDDLAKDSDQNYKPKFTSTQTRQERRGLLRKMYGKDALARPVDDLVYEPRVERREVQPA